MSRSLASLEADFQAYVLHGKETVTAAVVAGSRNVARERLGIYARAYELRLIEVLRADFPALRRMAGEETFDAMARKYIRDRPSRTRNARWFGQHLPDDLAAQSPALPHAALAEMARFEWTLGLAFDAPDNPPLTAAALAATPAARLGAASFRIHPSVQRIELVWNVPAVWSALMEPMEPPELQATIQPTSWIVWRPEVTSRFRALEPEEAGALDVLASGVSFAHFCETLARRMQPAEVPARAAAMLRQWIEEGLLAGIDFRRRRARRTDSAA